MNIEQLEFVRDAIDEALTGTPDPSDLVTALEFINDALQELNEYAEVEDAAEVQDSTPSEDENVPTDTDSLPF